MKAKTTYHNIRTVNPGNSKACGPGKLDICLAGFGLGHRVFEVGLDDDPKLAYKARCYSLEMQRTVDSY